MITMATVAASARMMAFCADELKSQTKEEEERERESDEWCVTIDVLVGKRHKWKDKKGMRKVWHVYDEEERTKLHLNCSRMCVHVIPQAGRHGKSRRNTILRWKWKEGGKRAKEEEENVCFFHHISYCK